MAKFTRQLQKKVRIEPKFLIILAIIVIVVFFVIRFIAIEVTTSIQKEYYKVNTIDEQDIYKGTSHSIEDDVNLLK